MFAWKASRPIMPRPDVRDLAAERLNSTLFAHSAFAQGTALPGRVGVWRSGYRPNISVAAPLVRLCLTGSTLAPFPHPAHERVEITVALVQSEHQADGVEKPASQGVRVVVDNWGGN
jgi:hypothetical protein